MPHRVDPADTPRCSVCHVGSGFAVGVATRDGKMYVTFQCRVCPSQWTDERVSIDGKLLKPPLV
jgi:hypothetical protein